MIFTINRNRRLVIPGADFALWISIPTKSESNSCRNSTQTPCNSKLGATTSEQISPEIDSMQNGPDQSTSRTSTGMLRSGISTTSSKSAARSLKSKSGAMRTVAARELHSLNSCTAAASREHSSWTSRSSLAETLMSRWRESQSLDRENTLLRRRSESESWMELVSYHVRFEKTPLTSYLNCILATMARAPIPKFKKAVQIYSKAVLSF